jgi:hypothetical protein
VSDVPGEDLVIQAPCAAATAAAPIKNEIPEDLKEAGDGLD